MSNFDSDPLTSDPALFPAENIPNSAKSNHIFRGKRRGDRALILRVLDSPMANVFPPKDTYLYICHLPGEIGGIVKNLSSLGSFELN